MTDAPKDIARYGLYGEGVAPVAPEFLHIEDIPSRSALYDWVIAPHTHQGIFQFLMVTQGGARVQLDGDFYDVQAPALICVPGNCVHAFAFAGGTQGWVLSVANHLFRDPRLLASGRSLLDEVRQGVLVPLADRPDAAARLAWLLSDMGERMSTERGHVPDIVTALFSVVLGVVADCVGQTGHTAHVADRRVQIVRGFEAQVDTHFRAHLSVSDYARALAVAPPTLTRACRAVLGKPPGDVIHDRVLLEAMRYLRHTAASAKQIADRLGFADPAYFARFFKSRSGMTPRSFRHALTEKPGLPLSTQPVAPDSAAT